MSLKTFHIFFISVCMLLCAFLLFWGIFQNSTPMLVFGGLFGIALSVYLAWFLKKLKSMGTAAMVPLLALLIPRSVEACATCFALSDELTRQATQKAMLFLIGVTTVVLIGVTAAVIHVLRHQRGSEAPDPS